MDVSKKEEKRIYNLLFKVANDADNYRCPYVWIADGLYTKASSALIGPEVFVEGLGIVKRIASLGGNTNDGTNLWIVFMITTEKGLGTLYKKSGYYTSYDGSTFDGPLEIVEPVEKTIIVYEPT